MCHLVLMLPVLALPVFWLWPLPIAASVYGAVLVVSLWIYVLSLRAMRRRVGTGIEELIGSNGIVVGVRSGIAHVRVHSEDWQALTVPRLRAGDRVRIVGIDGLRLRVERLDGPRATHGVRATVHNLPQTPS